MLTLFCQAQNATFSVRGAVVDSLSHKGVELATVGLQATSSDKIVTGSVADADGNFLLENVSPGKYQLSISFIGYNSKIVPLEVTASRTLEAIPLSASSKTFGTAVIVGEKQLITKTSEKTVFNVAESPVNQTGTAEDVLRNMPGVSVDQKGNITIVGKQGVKVLVDGRPNALAQSDLPSFLKSVPANSIEAIELITNPSAKYDAEGNAGIINIKLKKGRADGLNGSISASYGVLGRYNGNFNINYRKNKINVFASYAGNYSKTGNHWIENRIITLNDTTNHYNFDSKGIEQSFSNSLKAGLDYFLDDKNTITYTASGNYRQGHWLSHAVSQNIDAFQNETAQYNSTDDEHSYNFAVTNDIAYRKKFDSTERELDVDINHTYVTGTRNAALNSLAYDPSGNFDPTNSLYRPTTSSNDIHNLIIQVDYVHPLKKLPGYKIEAGLKNETTLNNNVFNAYDVVSNVETKDSLLSNSFNYTENISAAYGILSGSYKKWLQYSGGLRGEYTYIRSNDNSVNKSYPSIFPSATVAFAFNDTQNLSISYSRRVQRPQFRQINNTISYIDQYTTWQGNSFLQPSFSNIITTNYSVTVGKCMFSLEASGNFQTNIFIEPSHVDSLHITRGGVANGGTAKVFNFTFFSKFHMCSWWDAQVSQSYAYTAYGFKEGINLAPIAGHSYNLWLENDFRFWKNADFEVGGWFNSKGVNPQGLIFPVGGLHASFKKSFLNDHITVALSAINILNTLKWSWTVSNTGLITQGSWQELNRMLMLTLTYKFGSNGNPIERKSHDQNDRLDGGGGGRG